MTECKYFLVSGRVQGVSFRAATQREAQRLGLAGWVRNTHTGQVELLAQGEADVLNALESWLHRGPPAARVTSVTSRVRPGDESVHGFRIRD